MVIVMIYSRGRKVPSAQGRVTVNQPHPDCAICLISRYSSLRHTAVGADLGILLCLLAASHAQARGVWRYAPYKN